MSDARLKGKRTRFVLWLSNEMTIASASTAVSGAKLCTVNSTPTTADAAAAAEREAVEEALISPDGGNWICAEAPDDDAEAEAEAAAIATASPLVICDGEEYWATSGRGRDAENESEGTVTGVAGAADVADCTGMDSEPGLCAKGRGEQCEGIAPAVEALGRG